jgi:hypothetical protein
MYLPANPTARRREEALLVRARMEALDAKLDRALAMGREGASAPSSPFTDADVEEVGKLLVEGRLRLPTHARITVITEVETVKSRVFGTSEVFTHTADQLCCRQLQPMSIQAAIGVGLLAKLNGSWLWRENVYRQLAPQDPRLIT